MLAAIRASMFVRGEGAAPRPDLAIARKYGSPNGTSSGGNLFIVTHWVLGECKTINTDLDLLASKGGSQDAWSTLGDAI